jgi:hypothetical protein
MKLVVDVKDDKAEAVMGVIEHIKGVRSVKPYSKSARILEKELREAAAEVKDHLSGKVPMRNAFELLDEL